MKDGLGLIFVLVIAVAALKSCNSNDSYSFERQGIKPIVMSFWCGNECSRFYQEKSDDSEQE